MENLQNFGASTMDGSLVRDLEQRKPGRGHSDIMSCRLMNRERQRRYRARKRLEADMKRAALNRSTPLQLQRNVNGTPHGYVTRRHCQRDWKKDARKAHLPKKHEVKFDGPINPDPASASGNQMPSLPTKTNADTPANIESPRVVLSRRHWKMEARNKKS